MTNNQGEASGEGFQIFVKLCLQTCIVREGWTYPVFRLSSLQQEFSPVKKIILKKWFGPNSHTCTCICENFSDFLKNQNSLEKKFSVFFQATCTRKNFRFSGKIGGFKILRFFPSRNLSEFRFFFIGINPGLTITISAVKRSGLRFTNL